MTLGQFWTIILKRWKLIFICFLLLALGTYVGNKYTKPLYQSSSLIEVAISSSGSDINNLLASDQLVQTEAVLATSDPVLREVASHYTGLTPEQLKVEVTAAPKLNTQLFEIDVLDSSSIRAAAIANDVAQTLVKRQEQLYQQQTTQDGFLIIVQQAQPSSRPSQPNTTLNLVVGSLAGLFLGILLAVLFEQFDTRVRTSEELNKLSGWPVLATIWQSGREAVLNPTGTDINSESYRILRTNIGFSVIDKSLKSLLVTSAMPRDGKSLVAANLAIFMARAGKNTLLVDADLHHPKQHIQFGIASDMAGLSNAVVAFSMLTTSNSFSHSHFLSQIAPLQTLKMSTQPNYSLDPFMYSVGIPNLRVMPAGSLPPNPSELLDSQATRRLMQAIENCGAEVVIFDTPPLLGLSDTSILTAKVDAALIIVDITRADKKSLKLAKLQITQTGTPVLGCVINKQRRGRKVTAQTYFHAEQQSSEIHQGAQNGHNPAIPGTPTPNFIN